MRKRHALDSGRTLSLKVVWAGVLIAILLLPGITPAMENNFLINLILKLKNGNIAEGEILTAMEESKQRIPPRKFNRFHLGLGFRFIRPLGINQLENLIKEIGFANTIDSILFKAIYPEAKHARIFPDVFVEYSLSRKFALGLIYAPLGDYSVTGSREILGKKYSYKGYAYFAGSCNGGMLFLTASFFPIPDVFVKKTILKLAAGVGYGNIEMKYLGSESSNSARPARLDNIIYNKSFSRPVTGALLSAELIYFMTPHWSFGINTAYRYMPLIECKGSAIDYPYYYTDPPPSGGPIIFESLRIDIPTRSYDFGGFKMSGKLSFHF